MDTNGKSLITDNGRVTGVIAEGKNGEKVTLHAAGRVILATGGFAGNVELRQKYREGDKRPTWAPPSPPPTPLSLAMHLHGGSCRGRAGEHGPADPAAACVQLLHRA